MLCARPRFALLSLPPFIVASILLTVKTFPYLVAVAPQDLVYPSNLVGLDSSPLLVPRIIHQTSPSKDISVRLEAARQSCIALHPDYEYQLWTDDNGRKLVASVVPELLPTYDSYPYGVQRSDVLRLVALYKYGGVYLDTDVGCARSLDPLHHYGAVFPQARTGISQNIIAAERGHPFLQHLLANLPNHNHYWGTRYPTVFLSTGPLFVSLQYRSWSRHAAARDRVSVLARNETGNDSNFEPSASTMSFFTHHSGMSWVGTDLKVLKFIEQYATLFKLVAVWSVLLYVYIIWRTRATREPGGSQKVATHYYA